VTAIVLDTETTGLDPKTDRVIELAMKVLGEDVCYIQRYHPERTIPPEATRVHSIMDMDVLKAPLFKEHAEQVATWISKADAVVGQHVEFDKAMLMAEFARCGQQPSWPPLVCTKKIWNHHEPHGLMRAYKRFVHRDGFEQAHSAMADVRATEAVLLAQLQEFGLEGRPWSEVMPSEQNANWWGPTSHITRGTEGQLLANFGKVRGKPVHLVDPGYWRWLLGQDFPAHVKALAHAVICHRGDAAKIHLWVKANSL
jgi:DNA polymerase-3 subunit epsilon